MLHTNLVHARDCQRLIERLDDIRSPHRRAELPRDDVAREVVENRGQVVPASVDGG